MKDGFPNPGLITLVKEGLLKTSKLSLELII